MAFLVGTLLTIQSFAEYVVLQTPEYWGALETWWDELSADSEEVNAMMQESDDSRLPPALRHLESVSSVQTFAIEDHDALAASLRVNHPNLYLEYDRMVSEVEFRFSILPPLLLLILTLTATWSLWLAACALLLVGLWLQGLRIRREARYFVVEAMAHGLVESRYEAALEKAKAEFLPVDGKDYSETFDDDADEDVEPQERSPRDPAVGHSIELGRFRVQWLIPLDEDGSRMRDDRTGINRWLGARYRW